jgi:hypothetical protein
MRKLISDPMLLTALRALGAVKVSSARGSLEALFERDAEPQAVEDMTIVMSGPFLEARTSDVERIGLRRGEQVEVAGQGFIVRDLRPDAHGMTVLGLEEA